MKQKNQFFGYIISFFMLLALLNSGYFFIGILKLNIGEWLAFNACSLAIIVYLISFAAYHISKREYLLAIPLLPLYYYGTMGLFIMPWNEANIFAHVTHVIITVNVIWILYVFLREHKFDSLGKGTLAGILVFVPVFAWIQSYSQMHMNEFLQVLQKI